MLGVDEASGAVAVGDVVEVGQTVRFQVRDAGGAGEDLVELLGEPARARGALLFSCNGRGTAMFDPSSSGPTTTCARCATALGADGGGRASSRRARSARSAGRNHLHGFTASVLAFD